MLSSISYYIEDKLNLRRKEPSILNKLSQEYSECESRETMSKINSPTACSTEISSLEDLLKTSLKDGLSSKEVSHRKKLYGGNDFDIGEETPIWKKYLMMVKCYELLSIFLHIIVFSGKQYFLKLKQ